MFWEANEALNIYARKIDVKTEYPWQTETSGTLTLGELRWVFIWLKQI